MAGAEEKPDDWWQYALTIMKAPLFPWEEIEP